MNELKEHKELFRLASLIVCDPHDEERYRQDLLDYITTYTAKAIVEELNYIDDKLYDAQAEKGEWGLPTKWSKDNYADLWTPNEVTHQVIKYRIDQLSSQLTNNKDK